MIKIKNDKGFSDPELVVAGLLTFSRMMALVIIRIDEFTLELKFRVRF